MAQATEHAGGHTFEAGSDAGINPAACRGCHGGVAPEAIGDDFASRFDRALGDARTALEAALTLRGPCGRTAARPFDHDGAIRFRDAHGAILGDCDDDGRLGASERWPGVDALPRRVRDATHDLLLIERDGSHGRHNPAHAIRILLAIDAAL